MQSTPTFETAVDTLMAVARIDALWPGGWFVFDDVDRPTTGRWLSDDDYDGRLSMLPVRIPPRIGDDRQLRGQCQRALQQAIVARKIETATVRGARQQAA